MLRKSRKMLLALTIFIILAVALGGARTAKAAPYESYDGAARWTEPEPLTYIGKIEFSAYWPYEDSYNNNFKCEPLEGLVGEIVACPTGSDLLGKDILIMYDGVLIKRKVWDTGCKPGRLDLLVAGPGEMNAWGLRDCHVWIINETEE